MLKKLRILLLALLAALCCTVTAWADYDYIDRYDVTAAPNVDDGSLTITVDLTWTALEELPYGQELKIGVPNGSIRQEQALTDNIDRLSFDNSYMYVYFNRDYDDGETFRFSYSWIQEYMYTLGADGSYTYTLNNNLYAVQSLGVGETLTDTFTYTVTDSHGAIGSNTLTVTISGTNDVPAVAAAAAAIVTTPTSTTKLKATLRRPTPIVLSRPSSPIRLDTSDENRPANARAAKSTMAARNARVIDSNTTSWDVTLAIRSEVHTAAAPGTCSIMAAATAEGCAPSFTFTITHEIASKGSTLSQTLSRYGLSAAMVRAAFTSMKMVSSTLDPVGSRVPTQ